MVRIPNVNTSLIYILVVRQQNVDDAVRAYTLKVLCEYVVIKGVCCKVKISQANSRALFKLLCCLVFPVKRLIIFLTYFFFFLQHSGSLQDKLALLGEAILHGVLTTL